MKGDYQARCGRPFYASYLFLTRKRRGRWDGSLATTYGALRGHGMTASEALEVCRTEDTYAGRYAWCRLPRERLSQYDRLWVDALEKTHNPLRFGGNRHSRKRALQQTKS